MMPENTVVSIKEAKRLEEEGMSQDDWFFYWVKYNGEYRVAHTTVNAIEIYVPTMRIMVHWSLVEEIYAAPTINTVPKQFFQP